jgi:hypothetical protein
VATHLSRLIFIKVYVALFHFRLGNKIPFQLAKIIGERKARNRFTMAHKTFSPLILPSLRYLPSRNP